MHVGWLRGNKVLPEPRIEQAQHFVVVQNLSVGVTLRHAGGRINTIHYGYYQSDVTFSSVDWHAQDHAFVLSGGIEVELWHIRITPEVRYLRWKVPSNPSSSAVAYYLRVPQNEAQLLLGIGWHGR